MEDAFFLQLIELHTESIIITDTLFENVNERTQRFKLYNILIDTKLYDLLENFNEKSFIEMWLNLVKYRNKLVHGKYSIYHSKAKRVILNVKNSDLKKIAKI